MGNTSLIISAMPAGRRDASQPWILAGEKSSSGGGVSLRGRISFVQTKFLASDSVLNSAERQSRGRCAFINSGWDNVPFQFLALAVVELLKVAVQTNGHFHPSFYMTEVATFSD
jgi:hypothetical protein